VVDNPNSTTPGEINSSPPRDLHPVADIRFVINEIGKLTAKVDRLIDDTKENTKAIEKHSTKIASFQTTATVVGGAIVVVAIVFWWAFGDYVRFIVQDALRLALKQH
jgi:hypothetical protein